MADNRIIGEDGARIDFTCKNNRFRTNIDLGEAHGEGRARGSVAGRPLAQSPDGTYSLWLEHVLDADDSQGYWLMWYKSGRPNIIESAVFGIDRNIESMAELSRQIVLASSQP